MTSSRKKRRYGCTQVTAKVRNLCPKEILNIADFHSKSRAHISLLLLGEVTNVSNNLDYPKKCVCNTISNYNYDSSPRWLQLRLEFLGNLIILAAAMFAVSDSGLSAGLAGLSITNAQRVGTPEI